MRKLLNTLFVTSENSYLTLDGENIVIKKDGQTAARFPLHTLESILCFSYSGASPALMGACVDRNITLSFLTPNGKFLARTCGEMNGNVLLRRAQYRMADDMWASCRIASWFIAGKIYNSRWVLERATRDHAMRIDVEAVKKVSGFLKNSLIASAEAETLEELRGIEGEAAAQYFGIIDELMLQNRDVFSMNGRSRRPPMDAMNALLSFVYMLLSHDCAAALESVGLDSYVGFMHRDRPGRSSLALDLMEELRPVIADRFVLALINRQEITGKHFRSEASGAVFLNDDGRKIVLTSWQARKRETITHPYLEEKIQWGLVPYVQALLLARYIRGDMDAYPPFFWK